MKAGANPFIKPLFTEEMIERLLGTGLDGSPAEAGYEEAMNTLAEYKRVRNALGGLVHCIVTEFPDLEGTSVAEMGVNLVLHIHQLREVHRQAEVELRNTTSSLQNKLTELREEIAQLRTITTHTQGKLVDAQDELARRGTDGE